LGGKMGGYMRNKIKNVCERCGHIEFKETTTKTRLLGLTKGFFIGILLVATIIGLITTYNFFAVSYPDASKITTFGALQSFILNFQSNFMEETEVSELRNFTVEVVKNCTDDNCSARVLYDYLQNNWEYKEGTDMNALNILHEKEGDCDEMSNLYMHCLKTIGITAQVECSNNHCWNIVSLKDKKILADLTGYRWEEK
jgi:hypothetical protein